MMVDYVPKPERWDLLYRLHESAKNLSDHESEIKRLMQNACREMPTLGLGGSTSARGVTPRRRLTSREQSSSHIEHGGAPTRTKPASERERRALQKKTAPAGGVKGDEAAGTKVKGTVMVRERGQATSSAELSTTRQRMNVRSGDAAAALAHASVDLSARGQGGRQRGGEGAVGGQERPDTSPAGQGWVQDTVGGRRRPLEGDWRSQQRAMLKWQRELEIKEKSIRMREEGLLARRAAVQKKEMGLVELSDAELEGCVTRILHKEQRVNQRLEEVKEREESFHRQLTVLLEQERMEEDVQRMNLQLLSESVKHMCVRAEAATRAHLQTQRSPSPEVALGASLRPANRSSPPPHARQMQPGTTKLDPYSQPGEMQPGTTKLDPYSQPGEMQPGTTKLDPYSQPGEMQPGTTKLDPYSQPGELGSSSELRESDWRTYAISKSPASPDREKKTSKEKASSSDGRHVHVNVGMQGDRDVAAQSSETFRSVGTEGDRSEELSGLLNDSDKLEALTKLVGYGTDQQAHNVLMFCIDVETLQCVTDGRNDLERACREVFDLYVRKGARRDAGIGSRDAEEIAARLECGDIEGAMFARAQKACLETLLDLYKKSVT